MSKKQEYEIQYKFLVRRRVTAESPEKALEEAPVEEVEPNELYPSQVEIIDEEGAVVYDDLFDGAFGEP